MGNSMSAWQELEMKDCFNGDEVKVSASCRLATAAPRHAKQSVASWRLRIATFIFPPIFKTY